MKCSRCAKPATLHITEIRHGAVQALHLCESCAKEYLSSSSLVESEEPSDALAAQLEQLDEDIQSDLSCPNCGITFQEFRQQGRLGCPHDYVAFEDELMPLLENIHGETQHVGKFPKRAPKSSKRQYELIRLRNSLKAAVEEEQYEDAARLRDEIQSLESELAGSAANDDD